MAEGEHQRHEYYIRLLSFIIGPATETLHLYFEMKVLHPLNFIFFLEKHKHLLFHELFPSIPCCECKQNPVAAAQNKGNLTDTQFYSLFKNDEGQEEPGHKRTKDHQIEQFCLCSVSAKRSTTVEMMDITLLSAVIKACCPPGSISGHPSWIRNIRATRNYIMHCPNGKMTKSEFDQRFSITEQSVLHLASTVGSASLNIIKSQISYFKKSELSTIKDIITKSNDSLRQILELFVEGQTSTFESLADKTRNLIEKIETMNTQLQEQTRISVDIQNIVFEVKTELQNQQPKSTDPSNKIVSHDDDVCYVEWKLETPRNWDLKIEEVKEKLENVSSLLGKHFRIIFVYKGSLVIQTTAPKLFLQNDQELQLAVKSFLQDFVEICNIDSATKTVVKVDVVLSQITFASRYNVPEKMTVSRFACDPCSGKNVSSEAIQFCFECNIFFCHQCITNHNLNAAFLKHHLPDSMTLTLENFCAKHIDNILDYFCVEHDSLCCLSCKTEEHYSCQKIFPLEDVATDVKYSVMFQDVCNRMSFIRTTLDQAITRQDENIENLDKDEATISNQLANYKAKIIKRLDELEGITIRETRSLKKDQRATIESHKSSLLQIRRPINILSKKIDQVSKYGSQKQLFVLINKYNLAIINVETKLLNILPTFMTRRMIFKPREDVQNTIESLGSTRLNTSKYKADYKPPYIQQVQVPSVSREMPTKFTLDRKIEIKRSVDIRIRKMGITDDNRLLLCNINDDNLLVYSDQGDYLQDCKLSGSSWDIAVIPGEDKAVVTLPDKSSIQFIDIKTMRPGSKHYVPGICYAVGIANENICVGEYQGPMENSASCGQVHILNKKGVFIYTVKVPNISYINYLHPGPHESVYYTNRSGNAIGHLTLKGEEQFKYTSSELKGPNGIATDKAGNLYVACEYANNIQRITQNGELIDIILNTENDIDSPNGIAFSKNYRKLFVLNRVKNNKYVLVVFSCS